LRAKKPFCKKLVHYWLRRENNAPLLNQSFELYETVSKKSSGSILQ
jgi:hypothetical protein